MMIVMASRVKIASVIMTVIAKIEEIKDDKPITPLIIGVIELKLANLVPRPKQASTTAICADGITDEVLFDLLKALN